MKNITITVEVDGNKVSRDYVFNETMDYSDYWQQSVESMLETLEKSNDPKF